MNPLIVPKSIENACIFTDAESGVLEDSLDAIMAAVLERYNQDLQGSRGHKVLDDRKYVNLFFRLMREHPDYMPRSEYYVELGLKDQPLKLKRRMAALLPEVLRQPYVHNSLVDIAEARAEPMVDALDMLYLKCLGDIRAEKRPFVRAANLMLGYRRHLAAYFDNTTDVIKRSVAEGVLRSYHQLMIGFADRLEKGEIRYVRLIRS